MKYLRKLVISMILLAIVQLVPAGNVLAYVLCCPPRCSPCYPLASRSKSTPYNLPHGINIPQWNFLLNIHADSLNAKIIKNEDTYRIQLTTPPLREKQRVAMPPSTEVSTRWFGSAPPNPFDLGRAAFMLLKCTEFNDCDEAAKKLKAADYDNRKPRDAQDVLFYYSELMSIGRQEREPAHCYLVERIETNEIEILLDRRTLDQAFYEITRNHQSSKLLINSGVQVELVATTADKVSLKIKGINRLNHEGAIVGKVTAEIENIAEIVSPGRKIFPVIRSYRQWPWSCPFPDPAAKHLKAVAPTGKQPK
ncbi:MAG: hypothetical protein GXO34_06855 [Deltaproteobacteria bacterium]|nr:hypothetical protein [Deltaproteobacteria bacterium]